MEEAVREAAHGGRVVDEGARDAVKERAAPLDVLALEQAAQQQQRLPPHHLARVTQAHRQPAHPAGAANRQAARVRSRRQGTLW